MEVLSAEALAQRAMDNASSAISAGHRALSKNEALGQEAISSLMRGGTIPDKVDDTGGSLDSKHVLNMPVRQSNSAHPVLCYVMLWYVMVWYHHIDVNKGVR